MSLAAAQAARCAAAAQIDRQVAAIDAELKASLSREPELAADLRADLAARTGMGAFVHAVLSWLDDPGVELCERFDLAFHEVKTLLTESG